MQLAACSLQLAHTRWVTGAPDCASAGECADEAAWVTERGDAGVGVRAGRAQRVCALNGVLLGL